MPSTPKKSEVTERPNKRRAGAGAGGLGVAESRTQMVDGMVVGARCTKCAHPVSQADVPWCPVCFGPVEETRFEAVGSVWAATTVRMPVGRWRAPFGLAYVDLVDGPRVLAHVACDPTPRVGEKISVTLSDGGDLVQVGAEQEDDR